MKELWRNKWSMKFCIEINNWNVCGNERMQYSFTYIIILIKNSGKTLNATWKSKGK
jgi:hypothetical protein